MSNTKQETLTIQDVFSNRSFYKENTYFSTSNIVDISKKLYEGTKNNSLNLIIGDYGSGKTTFLKNFVKLLSADEYIVVYINESNLTPLGLYGRVLNGIRKTDGIYINDAKKLLIETLRARSSTSRILIILDDAHSNDKKTLIELNSLRKIELSKDLSNDEINYKADISVFLVGANSIIDNLNHPSLVGVRRSISLVSYIQDLNMDELKKYIRTRLELLNKDTNIFENSALDYLYEQTKGNISEINKICFICLNEITSKKRATIDKTFIDEVISTLSALK